MTSHEGRLLADIEKYYTSKLLEYGTEARGVDWSSETSQVLRFEKLLGVCNDSSSFSLNDYGCGYGALLTFLRDRKTDFQYTGYDISEAMVTAARDLHGSQPDTRFISDELLLSPADFTVASGIFNVKLEASAEDWEKYVTSVVDRIASLSTRGFAFNMLTLYSDADKRRPNLYYANPAQWFDLCKRSYSKFVALYHDYALWEFTIVVRR